MKWKRSGGRSWFQGLRLRRENELELPTHTETLANSIPANTGINGVSTGLARGSQPAPNGNYSDLRGFCFPHFSENLAANEALTKGEPQSLVSGSETVIENVEKKEKLSSNPVNPVESSEPLPDMSSEPHINPVTNPCQPHQTPLKIDSELNETELDIIQFIEEAIAQGDTETAQTVRDLLTKVCNSGAANQEKIWLRLGAEKQATFKALLN